MNSSLTRAIVATTAGAVCATGLLAGPARATSGCGTTHPVATTDAFDPGEMVAAQKARMVADWVEHARDRMRTATPRG